jgi:hypothetical protein
MLAAFSSEARAQADAVVGTVTKKVERVGQQRGRLRGETGADLDREHGEIDNQCRPQHAAVDRRGRGGSAMFVSVIAAMGAHLNAP